MTLSIRIIDIADNHLSDLIGKHRYRATGLLDATRNRLQMTIRFANVVMSVCFLLGWWFHFRVSLTMTTGIISPARVRFPLAGQNVRIPLVFGMSRESVALAHQRHKST